MTGLAVTTVNKMKIVQEGALSPLTLLLTSADVEILREVVACFCNLSISDENKLEIVKSGEFDNSLQRLLLRFIHCLPQERYQHL